MNTLTGYSKSTLTDSYLLTAAGGHKAISDFASATTLSDYVTLNSNLTISGVKTFSSLQKFTVAAGTAPFQITSDTKVTNLNADCLDDYHETSFFRKRDMSASNVNFNDYFTNGVYVNTTGNGTGNSNVPSTYGYLLAFYGAGSNSYYGGALIHIGTNGNLLTRAHWAHNWSTWKTILDSSNSSVSGGGSSWGSSITVKINGETTTLTIPSNPDTWRPITDTYEGTSLSSTTSLSLKGANSLQKNVIAFKRAKVTNENYDANTLLEGVIYNYYGYSAWKNAPTGMLYGKILNLIDGTDKALSGLLAWDINHASTTDTTRYLWWRATDNGTFKNAKWHRLAYVDDIPSIKTLTFSAGTFAETTYNGSANVTVNVPSNFNHIGDATLVNVTSGTVKRKVIVTNIKSEGYISRASIGLSNPANQFSPVIIGVGTNDAGTAYTDYYFHPGGSITDSKGNTYAKTSQIPTIPNLSLGTTTGNGNAVTSISVDGHKITLNKGTTFSVSDHTHSHLVSGAALSGSDHAVALKTYFTNNYSSIPRNSLNTYSSSAMSNTSQYFGYFAAYHNDAPYGGFYVAHYDKPYYVGISNGTFTQHLLAKITDITKSQVGLSNVQNTAFYQRATMVNGVNWSMAGTANAAAFTIYAPTTGGTAGYILKSNKDAAPTWIALSDISAGKLGGYEESKFLRSKSWMPAGTINDYLHGIYATGTNITDVPKDANGNNLTYSTVLAFDALVGSGYGKVLFYVKSALLYYRHYWDSKWYDWYQIALKSNIPTKVSQLLNDSGYLTTRGYIGTTSVLASSAALKLKGINGLYLSEDSSGAINNKGVNFCNSAGNIKHSIGATSNGPGFGIYSSGTLFLRAGCNASTSVDTALTSSKTGLVLDASGNLTVSGTISASNFSGVGNGKITIKLNNTEVGSFTMNQSSAGTINLTDTTYSLVGANGTTGLIKNGSTVTTTTGYIACPIINGVPYYWDTVISNTGVTPGDYIPSINTLETGNNHFLQISIPKLNISSAGRINDAELIDIPITKLYYIANNITLTNDSLGFITTIAIFPGCTVTLPTPGKANAGKVIYVKKAALGSAPYISGKFTNSNTYGTDSSTRSFDIGNNSYMFVCMNVGGANYSWVIFYCG